MNFNIISNIFSYLNLEKTSNILNISNNKVLNDNIISKLAVINNTSYNNIKAKINNHNYKCGKCNNSFIGDYAIRLGLLDCKVCDEKKNFNIEICQSCLKQQIKRGEFKYINCKNNHINVYLGINILSY